MRSEAAPEPSCNARILHAFVRYLTRHGHDPSPALLRVGGDSPEARVRLDAAYRALAHWVRETGDADLGLKVALGSSLGSSSVLDYALHSSPTPRSAVELAQHYRGLFSEGCTPSLEVDDDAGRVYLDGELDRSRTLADFTMALWFRVHLRALLGAGAEIECLFAHPAPADLTAYQQTFGDSQLTFDAPRYGFRFDPMLVDRANASADPLLHAVHCAHLERLQSGLLQPLSTAARVRELLARELRHGRPTAEHIARELHMSRRTLVRRLASEGTGFTQELDQVRQQLALRIIVTPRIRLEELCSMLAFSHVQGFYRAFKRWTGQTPGQYRSAETALSSTAS